MTAHRGGDDRPPFEPTLQVFSQRFGCRIAGVWLTLQALRANRFELAIQRRDDRTQRWRRFVTGLSHHGQGVFAEKWWAARE